MIGVAGPSPSLIDDLLSLSRDQLLVRLAEGTGKFAGATDLRARGLEIYSNIVSKVRAKICESELIYKSWCENPIKNKHIIIAAAIDCISGVIVGVSPATLCVLIYKDGLPAICTEIWKARFEKN